MADNYSADGISDAPPTAEQTAQVEAGRARLAAMTGGTTPGADLKARLNEILPEAKRAALREAVGRLRANATPGENRRVGLTKDLASGKLTEPERAQKTQELRELLAGMATDDEKAAMASAPLEDHRSAYGLTVPDESVLPKHMQEEYEQEYSGHEGDFLLAARQQGLDSRLVGELRDAGIRMAIAADGKPVTDEAWAGAMKKFEGRLTAPQRTALRAWWKASVEGVEGGGAA